MGEYVADNVHHPRELEMIQSAQNEISPCFFPVLTDGVIVNGALPQTTQQLTALDLGSLCVAKTLRDLCDQNDLSLSALFNGVWALVLGRYLDSESVGFVALSSTRSQNFEGVCFAQIDRARTVKELFRQMEAETKDSFKSYQSSSLSPRQLLSASQRRQVLNSVVDVQGVGCRLESNFENENEFIRILVKEAEYHVEAGISYNTSLLPRNQAANIATSFSHVLAHIAHNLDKTIETVEFVSEEHLQQIWQWNTEYPKTVSACAHQLIAKQVQAQPEAEAVCSWDGNLTYSRLDALSTQLAHHLVGMGVGPDVIVPLCFEKSVWAIVAILAVVKAGGAIVSVDPKQPKARSEGIMDQVSATLVLTSAKYHRLWMGSRRVFVVDEESFLELPKQTEAPVTNIKPENILYLIFTSGSTGKPKGCVVEHASFFTGAARQIQASNMSNSSRVLQMTPYSFDVSMLEIFTALTAGACICVPGEEDVAMGVASLINQYQISWTFMTPSLVRLLNPKDVPSLKTLALGGEALSTADVRAWAEHLQLINGYGPTECSVASTINERLSKNSDPANIGRGSGALCWVVDANDHNRLVPIGAVGELLIHGPIVARGYYNDSVKTNEVFIQNPDFLARDKSGRVQRLYKSGDLVRNNSDGTINFIGRKDNQVKLRGQRLELGEIEHHLSTDKEVRHAVIVLPKHGRCRQNLVAVLSLNDFEGNSNKDSKIVPIRTEYKEKSRNLTLGIQARLSDNLPIYMVPTIWVVLEAVPLSTSGKMNRLQVSKWVEEMGEEVFNEFVDATTDADTDIPATDMQRQLQTIWSGVLNVPVAKIGLGRSFLSLGGDSIISMQVVARCRTHGLRITVQDVLQSKNVPELASRAITMTSEEGLGEGVLTAFQRVSGLDTYDLSKIGVSSLDDIEDVYPCASMQEGILLSQARDPGTYAIRQIFRTSSKGSISITVQNLSDAWQKVVDRHGSLRTVFVDDMSEDNLFHQIRLRHVEATVRSLSYTGPDADIVSFLENQVPVQYRPAVPEHQLTVCESARGTIYLMVEINHALIDGGSTEILMRDFCLAYDGTLSAESGPLYSDYITYLQKQPQEESVEYWKAYLAGIEPCVVPLYDGNKTGPKQTRVTTVDFKQGSQVLAFCKEHEITVANLLATAWGLVLRAYTASDDVCFGFVASGRDIPVDGIEEMVGACINMLVCRLVVDEKSEVAQLAKKMQDNYFASLPHQHCSLAKIQHALDMAGMPLFNTILSLQRAVSEDALEGQTISFDLAGDADPTDFDLAVAIEVSDNDLRISLGYWSSTMSDDEAANISSTLSGAIRVIMENGNANVKDLNLFNDRDKSLIFAWNRDEPACVESSVPELINKQVQLYPTAPAICSWDGDFTYRELDELSTRLACHLVSLGVVSDVLVPYCFDKSAWATISALAILKAGGAFVGLSSSSPVSRLNVIIGECHATIVLSAPQHSDLFDGMDCRVLVIDEYFVKGLPMAPRNNPLRTLVPSNPAYVSFTSGSTGKPKGIVVEHGSLITSILGHGPRFAFGAGTRVLQFSSYAFDASIAETFTTLVHGGCVCIPSEQERLKDLAGAINRMDVNFSFLTPRVASTLSPQEVPTLKTIILGGEAVSIDDIQPWIDAADLFVAYGPTETTICAMGTEPLTRASDPLNLGHATGARLWVTEPSNTDRLALVGTVGELIIEGRLVARGYINEPEKTAAVFFEDPAWLRNEQLSNRPRRFYKTGDLVRYQPDGTLKFIGRKDTQVKIRGQRVELGEIEHTISQHMESLAHVTVDAVILPSTGQALVAFLYLKDAASAVSSDDLVLPLTPKLKDELDIVEKKLSRHLPSYMVPSIFIPLSRIPMSIAGKVDRLQLRQATLKLTTDELAIYALAGGEKRAPTTEMGRRLQEMWANVLGRASATVGADDSFFRLGGDSIIAMRLATAARNAGISLAVADIFAHPELEKMAAHIENSALASEFPVMSAAEPFGLLGESINRDELIDEVISRYGIAEEQIRDIYPCTPLQEGLMSISTRQQGSYVTQSTFRLPKILDLEEFKAAWQIMVDAYSILRTRVVLSSASKSYQLVLRQEPLIWQTASTLEAYLKRDQDTPITYGGSLIRFATVEGNGVDRYFVFTAHHAVYDGWTLPLLFSQLAEVYHSGRLTIPETPFNSFIKFIENTDGNAANEFWRSQLSGEAGASFPRMPSSTYQPQTDEMQSYLMRNITRKSGSNITMSTVLRASWALVLARYLDNADNVLFGQTLSGRNAPVKDIERMFGPTITTVPIKIGLNRSKTVALFLEDVQRQATAMIPFEHTGLREIRRVSQEAAAATDFKNLFITHTAAQTAGNLDLLGLEEFPVDAKNFDTYALVMECTVENGGINFAAHYDSAVISAEKVQRMIRHFEHVIRQVSEEPTAMTLDQVDLFGDSDKEQVLGWSGIAPDFTTDCIHEVIKRQVALRPKDVAVDAWDGQLTYHELDDLSSRLAHYLSTRHGIKAEILVPMCFDKSVWTVVAMLAVLKAGGACVMLNPDHPVSRLQSILSNVTSEVALVAPQHRELFDSMKAPALTVGAPFIRKLPTIPRGAMGRVQVAPNNTAVVVFTSGSTGKPKGIVMEHRAICTVSTQHCPQLGYRAGMRVLQFAHFTFDMSNAECFVTLMHGGTICIPSDHDRLNNLAGAINAMKIDWLLLTPTVAGLLHPNDVPDLKTLVLIGEAVDQALMDRWAGKVKTINSYGPAECTMWTSHAVSGDGVVAANIGRGYGCRMWIAETSDHNRLTPIGCAGELLIEGPIVARGYLNDPEKTAAAFIENPPWLQSNDGKLHRVYKSGDLVRYNKDGSILFLGRKDSQVKLHGQRIELGEIEHHVRVQGEVETAMVALPKSGPCKGRLVVALAFKEFEPKPVEEATVTLIDAEREKRAQEHVATVRNQLSDQLPPYMVPTVWIVLGTVPVTPSRKINRNPISAWIESMSEEVYKKNVDVVADENDMPSTEVEKIIQDAFSHILGKPREQIGVNRSFISVGGDSITAMQVVSKCRAKNIEISVKNILQSKSLSALALVATTVEGSVANQKPEEFDTPFGLSPIQQFYFDRIAAIGGSKPSGHHFNQSILLSMSRRVNEQEVSRAIEMIVGHHSMLRAYFTQEENRTWMQVVRKEVAKSYYFGVHDVDSEEEMICLIGARQCSMKIQTGPLFKVDMFNLADERQLISIVAHHLIVDMVSWRIIIQNLEQILETGSLAMEKPLPFQIWNGMQANHALQLSSESVLPFDVPAADLGYWGFTDVPNIYRDNVQESFTIDEQTTSMLLGQSNDALRTEPLELFLSALLHSFKEVFRDRLPPTIFIEGHGRESWDSSLDLSNTVGWFTTFSPLDVPVRGEENIIDVVRQVKDTRRRIPSNGHPYFSFQHLNNDVPDAWGKHQDMEITFNYLGRRQLESADGLLRQEPVSDRANVGKDVRSPALFDVSAIVIDGSLQFCFTHNNLLDHEEKIQVWFSEFEQTLRSAASVLTSSVAELTLSDFPLLPITYDGLSTLMNVTLPQIGVSTSNIENVYPCSPMQEGILLSQSREPGTYEIHQISQIMSQDRASKVDISRLQAAWQMVVNRHPLLRTIFLQSSSEGGIFDQLVLKSFNAEIEVLHYNGTDVVSFLEDRSGLQCNEPIPPHRVMFCESQGKTFWRMDISHALIDGISLANLTRDFVLAYESGLSNGLGPLYSDYISYLQAQPNSLAIESLDYWKGYLAGVEPCRFPSLMEVPESSAVLQHRELSFNIANESVLQDFCQEHGISLGNLFQAAWGLILRAYTGSDQACFGYMASGRNIPVEGIDDAVGPFVNVLICRIDLELKTGAQIIRQMQDDYLNSLPYQHTSLAKVQHALDMSGMALFNTVMSLQRKPAESAEPALSFEIAKQVDPSEYEIVMQIATGRENVELTMTYLASNMTEDQALNIANAFSTVIKCIVAEPEKPIADLNLFSEHDSRQVWAWNGAAPPPATESCVHWMISENVRLRPKSPAIASWDANLTYQELDDLSSRLASQLVSKGVGPEIMVPICFPKSAWTVVTMIAILKAGGCTVTLNPKDPVSRLENLIADTNAVVLLAASEFIPLFVGTKLKTIMVDGEVLRRLPHARAFASTKVKPNNPAVVMFTSGSTGQPKGIVVEHRSLCTVASKHGPAMNMTPEARVLNYSAYTWDASTAENLYTLVNGGCVCVPSDHERMNDITGAVRRLNANWAFLTPTVAGLLDPADLPSLRTFVLGGEAIPATEAARWQHLDLFNVYGPAECSVYTSNAKHRKDGVKVSSSSLGRGIGSRLWVTDVTDHNRLCPVGALGELLIEGPIVTRGYMNNPQKTAESFIDSPAWMPKSNGKTRIYKTGDLVRYNPDGTLNILGRIDSQVKLNGQRMELSEIESQIKFALPTSYQVAVDITTPLVRNRKKTLAAFLCKDDGISGALTSSRVSALDLSRELRDEFSDLQAAIAKKLPFFMIPTAFIPVSQLPLTTSLKVDRKVLRQLGSNLSEEQLSSYALKNGTRRAPSTKNEKVLHALWAQVLGISDPETAIGAEDSFFALGGDSVGAMKLVAAGRAHSLSLTVADIFQHPALADMAQAVDKSDSQPLLDVEVEPFELVKDRVDAYFIKDAAKQCKVSSDLIEDIYPCTPLQEALMAISTMQSNAYVLQDVNKLPASLDIERFQRAWQVLINTHSIFRTRIITKPSGALQVVLKEDISWNYGTSLEKYLEEDKEIPIVYGGELVRYAIVGQPNNLSFVWTAHHAVYDGWTLPMVLDQVTRIYSDQATFTQVPYNRFIHYLEMVDREASDRFWRDQFSGNATSFPALPSATYVPRPRQAISQAITVTRKFGSAITIATVLRAAWAIVTARHADTDDVVFGLTLSGRNAPVAGIAEIMGPTITTVPVRVSIDPTKRVKNFLEDIQRQATEMIPYEHTGLQNIRRLGPDAQSAVDFKNLLVIQIDGDAEQSDESNPLGLEQVPLDMGDFDTYALAVECKLNQKGVLFDVQYDENVVGRDFVERLLHQFEHVINQLVLEPYNTTVGEVNMIPSQDWEQLMEWNSAQPEAVPATVHGIVEVQALVRPEASAICGFDGNFTYHELNALSTTLAHHLVSLGVGPEVKVPLCFPKSSWTIIAMLAVMKSGGVCVLVNPDHPIARLQGIFDDVEATVLLCDPSRVQYFSEIVQNVVSVDAASLAGLPPKSGLACPSVQPSNAVFVVYTSGSTGKPKGIILEHRSLCTSLLAHGKEMRVGPDSRTLQFAAYTFDVSIEEIVTTLMLGGCVCVLSDEDRLNNLAGAINDLQANWSELTPTVASLLKPSDVPTLKTLALSGEAVTQEVVNIWGDHVFLINTYGPSECCVSTCCNTGVTSSTEPSNIGFGTGCLLWITDARTADQLAPLGTIGELLIEGPIVARGYLNEPEKTAAAFIKNPIWSQDGSKRDRRFYKTGDLVKYNPDGSIKFIGRKDTQVKLHGQRIEMGEIEHHVKLAHAGFVQVAVEVLVLGQANRKNLAAFVCLEEYSMDANDNLILPLSQTSQSLFRSVQQSLHTAIPAYMVPSLFIPLKEMPLSTSGKLDRKALRQLATSLSHDELTRFYLNEDVVSSTPTSIAEKRLQRLWAAVLKVPESAIGSENSFFRLGGDSIGAMKLVAAARESGILLTVTDIFENATLSAMAAKVENGPQEAIFEEQIVLEPFALIKDEKVSILIKEAATQCSVDEELIQDIYPCTPIQEGLMALSARQKDVYIARSIFRLPASINLQRYKSSWQALADEHSILKTRVVHTASFGTLQVIMREDILWRSAPTLEEYVKQDKELTMGYGKPLIRYGIVEDKSGVNYFIWTAHHAAYDGWSEAILFEQVERNYRDGSLPSPSPYKVFIDYLVNKVDSKASDAFWREQMTGGTPTTFPRMPSQKYQPRVNRSQSRTLQVSRKAGSEVTMSTILRAAWAAVQARHSDSDDVVFGLTLSGRNAPVPGISEMMGPTISTVPLRVNIGLEKQKSVAEYLRTIHNQSIAMIPFEHAGLQNIQRLGPQGASFCEFQTLFYVQPSLDSDPESLGLQQIETDLSGFDTFALLVECQLQDNKVEIVIRHDNTIVPEGQVHWILSHFEAAILALNDESSEILLEDLDLFGSADQVQLLEWNSKLPSAVQQCVHDMVKAQVLRRPNAEAVHSWDGEMTYKQLDGLSARLGYSLSSLGVRPGVIVPLCFDKSVWAVVSMLAVMKAGGACLSMNPTHPISRLQEIIVDSSANVVLVTPKYSHLFQGLCQHLVVVKPEAMPGLPLTTPKKVLITPKDPVFIVNTSGSTGKPKSVVTEHGALSASIRAHGPALKFESGLRVLQFAAYTFDISIAEIFTTLTYGGCVCIPSEQDRTDNLAGAMNRMNVTWACLTSTVANLITPAEVPGLKTLVLSGEAPTQANLNSWGGKVHLINAYGPSECSIWSSYLNNLQIGTSPTNIGRGLGSRLWIAEGGNEQRLAPLGCVGELLIEGPIMARGYLGAPEKTAAVFIESPPWLKLFGTVSHGSRMYKTGDSARYNTDGTIEYLGRRDAQAKINGQRIEMGEIEYHLKQQFSTAKGIAVDIPANQKTLAAFFCLETEDQELLAGSDLLLQLSNDAQSRLTDLQTSLLSLLPKYMVPTLYVPLASMPTTASGKLDRKALRVILNDVPKDQLQRYALANVAKRAPSTSEEMALARLWGQALGVSQESIGVNDNFFQLGGDSIVAMRLVGLARAEGMGLKVANIFQYPILAEAAAHLGSNDCDTTQVTEALKPFDQLDVPNVDAFLESVVCPKAHVEKDNIENVLDTTDFQSLAITGGLTETRWMLNYFYFESEGSLDLERMRKACAEVVQRFDILRTVFILHKAKFLQVVLKTLVPKFRFSKTDQDLDTFTKMIYKSGLSSYLPLEESMVQFYVVKHKQSPRHRVIMRISHAQYDGVSLPIIWEYFKSAYEGQASGQPTSFTSYVSHSKLRQTEDSYQYWRSLLAGSAMTDIVSHDKPNVRKSTDVPEVLTQTVRAKSLQSEGITFATVIKAAWALVLSQLAGRSDVVFGHTISGRNLDLDEVEKVVGACINVVPVRVVLRPGWKVIDLLHFVQDQQLSNVPHETLGTREIMRQCTDWPQYNYFSTIVQHQNIDPDESIMLGDKEYTPGFMGSDLDLVDIGILSTPMGDKVEISLTYSSTTISPIFAKGLLSLLSTTVRSFSASPFESLPPLQSRQPLIPTSRNNSPILPTMSSTDSFKEMRALTEKDQMKLQNMLESAWSQVLHYDDKSILEVEISTDISFFDLGGDMVQVAQLACVLAERGFRVKLEDLVDYDTIDEQVELLAPLLV